MSQAAMIRPDAHGALIVVDVQNCFASGALAVPDGAQVVPVVNRVAPAFENVVLTQDWHAPGHASFSCFSPAWRPISAWPGRRSMRAAWASRHR